MISKSPTHLLCVGALSLCALAMTSCTQSEADIVYIKVFNGYAGGGAVSVLGPQGEIASDVQFGEDSGEAVAVDRRNYDGQLTIVYNGVPRVIFQEIDLFALYPEETATLFFTRRSSLDVVNSVMLRHTHLGNFSTTEPSSSETTYACVTEFHNGLSTNGTTVPYDISTQWFYQDIRDADYLGIGPGEFERNITSPCGPIQLDDPQLKGQARIIESRTRVYNTISNDTWFYLVEGANGGSGLSYQYGGTLIPDHSKLITPAPLLTTPAVGQVLTYPSSQAFVDCISESLQFETDDSMGAGGFGGEEPECAVDANGNTTPPVKDGFYQLEFLEEDLEACLRPQAATPKTLNPAVEGGGEAFIFYWYPALRSQPQNRCQAKIRLRTTLVDAVFDVEDYENGGFDLPPDGGAIADRNLVEVDILAPRDTWSYVVIYGRPIEPFVYQMFGSYEAQNFSRIDYPANTQNPNGTPPPEENPRKNPLFGN